MAEETKTVGATPRAGDPLPASIESLLAAFAAGDAAAAAACFGADAIWGVPSHEDHETAARAVHTGEAIEAALAADPHLGRAHDVRLCLHEGDDCLLEGEILGDDGTPDRGYGMSVQLAADGKIDRALLFRIEPVVDNAGTDRDNPSGVEIQAQIDEYFHELDAARFESATTYFSADGMYLHPPYAPNTPRVAYAGTDELLAGFEKRGAQTWEHFTDVSIQRGAYMMFEGHVLIDGTPEGPTGCFISSATVDEDGKILRYLAFYTAPLLPRR
jgi:ketosteroid isomerase-like protein